MESKPLREKVHSGYLTPIHLLRQRDAAIVDQDVTEEHARKQANFKPYNNYQKQFIK